MNKKTKTILLIVLLSVLALSLVFVTINLIKKPMFFNFQFNTSKNLIMDKTYDLKFEKININTDAAEIDIKTSLDENIQVKVYSEKENATIKDANNELNINLESERCIGLCFNYKSSKIEIYLPSNFDKNIVINNSYGNIKIGDFKLANININTDSGNINVESVNIIDVDNSYGNIKIKEAKEGNIISSSGNININNIYNIRLENSYGNVNIDNVLNKAEIKEECGNIKITNLDIKENSSITNSYGNIKINNTSDIYIETKTELGNTKVNNNNNKSDITLKIINDCGNIKVN